MTDDRDPLHKLEDPMIELGTLYRTLRYMAADMESEHSRQLQTSLYSIANHLEHIYDDLYEHYEATTEAVHKDHCGPRLVDKGAKP